METLLLLDDQKANQTGRNQAGSQEPLWTGHARNEFVKIYGVLLLESCNVV